MSPSSENAKAVARDVIESVRKGVKIKKGEILKRHGYSDSMSKKPKKVTETKSYKSEIQPLVEALDMERKAIIERWKKTRNKAKYRDLTDAMDKITKNIQLLTGKPTDNINISDILDEAEKK